MTKIRSFSIGGVTYQHKMIKCGKPSCSKLHGPYWYAFWKSNEKIKCKYVGRNLPEDLAIEALDVRRRRRG